MGRCPDTDIDPFFFSVLFGLVLFFQVFLLGNKQKCKKNK